MIALLVYLLFLSFIFFICGFAIYKHTPKKINYLYGYRTSMSCKNEDTWIFANKYCGRIYFYTGIITAILSPIFAFIYHISHNNAIILVIFCNAPIISLFVPIFFTEKALRKHFDKKGNKIL